MKTSERGDESFVEKGVRNSVLFSLCASSTLCIASLILGVVERKAVCDEALAPWNVSAGMLMFFFAATCSCTLQYDPNTLKLITKFLVDSGKTSLLGYGTTPLAFASTMLFLPILITVWCFEGYSDILHSATCRRSAPILFAGTIVNMCLIISNVTFGFLMLTYHVTAAKGFHDLAILKCVCNPLGVVSSKSMKISIR